MSELTLERIAKLARENERLLTEQTRLGERIAKLARENERLLIEQTRLGGGGDDRR